MIYNKIRALFSRSRWLTITEIDLALKTYNLRSRIIIFLVGITFLVGLIGLILSINNYFLVSIAVPGGSLTEGIIGAPRFINPLLATSDSDRDLTTLVYSGLLRPNAQGALIGDIADDYTISPDGLTYTFNIKKNLTWQDGEPLTAADVVFTIDRARDARVKSVKRANWEGVIAETAGPNQVVFTLTKPYSGFIANTTMGIIPKHIWEKVRPEDLSLSEKNINPIGSGPYKISTVKKDTGGIPTVYNLVPFRGASAGMPKISDLKLIVYSNEKSLTDAYRRGEIESLAAISPEKAKEYRASGSHVLAIPLPRVFAVFFNLSGSGILTNRDVRKALDLAIDKEAIVQEALYGYSIPIDNPVPPGSVGYLPRESKGGDLDAAKKILAKSGWKVGANGLLTKTIQKSKKVSSTQVLSFTLVTSNTPELKRVAELIVQDWKALGADVRIEFYESGDLTQDIIQKRKYDAVLFGEVLSREPDLFPYWHSSQRNYPGLNISMYANPKVDKLIEETRSSTQADQRQAGYKAIQKEITNDAPAIFLYTPSFIYIVPEKLKRVIIPSIINPSERFLSINNWYINTDKVWRIFANRQDLI